MVILTAHFAVQPDKMEASILSCSKVRTESHKEPACLEYDFFQSPDNPLRMVFLERWETREGLEEHFGTEHFKQFFAEAQTWLATPPEITIYSVSNIERPN
jgi:quinol monooxygenase YgiN